MAKLSRFIPLVPAVFCIIATILAALCLFAGHEKGFMEDYAIARLNTSRIGHNLVDNLLSKRGVLLERQDIIGDITDGAEDLFGGGDDEEENADEEDDGNIIDDIGDGIDDISDDVGDIADDLMDELNDIGNNAADELAEALGLAEWYSIHVMAACQGFFKPEPTAENAGLNISYCNATAPDDAFKIDEIISEELEIGPFDLSLEDLGWNDDIQDQLDNLNDVLLALFVLYVLSVGLNGLGVFTAAAAFVWPEKRSIVLINLGLVGTAAILLVAGSAALQVGADEALDEINDVGEDFGIEATRGSGFFALTWAATAFSLAAALIWAAQFVLVCVKARKARTYKHRKSSI